MTYNHPHHAPGKTSSDADEVDVRFVRLVQDRCIEQAVTFESDDPVFAGQMRIVWAFEPDEAGTRVTVRCTDVPVGIGPEDHQAGLNSTLDNLVAYVERMETGRRPGE